MRQLLFAVFNCLALCRASMIIEVAYGKKECIRLRVPSEQSSVISGNYDLLEDEVDGSTVTAWLTKISGFHGVGATLWHSDEEEHEDTFDVSVDPVGVYELCFEVETDPENDEEFEAYAVGFNLRLDPIPRSLDEEEKGPDTEQALKLIEAAKMVETDWRNLADHYDYFRNREALNVQLSNKIQSRVMGWTLLEAVLVIAMATGQVLYWKKFFETVRYL